MIGFTALVVAAALGLGLGRWLRLPAIPFLLIGGALLSRLGVFPHAEILQTVLLLGLAVLAFAVGMEMAPERVGKYRSAALGVGLVQFVVLAGTGFGAAVAFGYSLRTASYLALALSASSTLVAIALLRDRKELSEPHARMTVGVLLLQDLLVILLIPVAARAEEGVTSALIGLLSALALVVLAYLVLRYVTPLLVVRMELDEERLLLGVIAVLFLFVGAADLLGLPLIAGGFLGGVAMSSFPARGILRGQMDPFSDFFAALFFTSLGALIQLPAPGQWLHVLVFAGLVVLLTPPLVAIVAERFGISRRPALESGLVLAQTSEFSLVVGIQALALGHMETDTFTVLVLVTALTMVATPFLLTHRVTRRLLRFHMPGRGASSTDDPTRDHILVLGAGENGIDLLESLRSDGFDVLAVDDDPSAVARVRRHGLPALLGDASDLGTLERAGARQAKAVISTLHETAEMEPILQHLQGVPVYVRVFSADEAMQVEEWGGTPVLYADAAADDFVRWFEEHMAPEPGTERSAPDLGDEEHG